jgi:hypothetical protein
MADSNSGDSAAQRREKLKALRERRRPGQRDASSGDAAAEGDGEGGGERRAKLLQMIQKRAGKGGAGPGGGGAGAGGGESGGRRARLRKAMQDPEQREKLMERFPQLRERMGGASGGEGGQGPRAGGGRAGGGRAGAGRRGAGAGGGRGADSPALGRQVKALESRLAALEDELKKVRSDDTDDTPAADTGNKTTTTNKKSSGSK